MIIFELARYLPNSPADMKSNKAPSRRIKELECCIAYSEFLYLMFNETQFYTNRTDVISEEKYNLNSEFDLIDYNFYFMSRCKLLVKLINTLVCDPELAVISNESLIEESYFSNEKVILSKQIHNSTINKIIIYLIKQQELVCDLTIVTSNLIWEILNSLKMASWSNEYFNFDMCIELIEKSLNFVSYY